MAEGKTPPKKAPTPSYEHLSLDDERAIVGDLLAQSPELMETEARFGLVVLSHDSPYANLARSVESEVFQEFFGNDPELMAQEYGPYEVASTFFLVIDKADQRRAGVMRLLGNSDQGFKALNDVSAMGVTALPPEDVLPSFGVYTPDQTLEIATIAAAPDYRGSRSDQLVSAAMYRALYRYCNGNGYGHLIAIIDAKPLANLHDIHLPVYTSPEVASPFEYLDAKANSLIHIPIGEIESHMRSRDAGVFDFLLGDPGLDPYCTLSFQEK